MDIRLLFVVLIGVTSSVLVNRDVAVFNDGFRPVYAEYFDGGMDRRSLGATGFAVSIGLLLGYGLTTSIAVGILIFHSYLLASDIIGSWCAKSSKGMILSGILGAVWALTVYLGLNQINAFFSALPVDVMTPLGTLADYVIATFPFFPAVATAYQFGAKKGFITGLCIAVSYMMISKFGIFTIAGTKISLSAAGMAMLIGMAVLITFAMKAKGEQAVHMDTSIFDENTKRIRKNMLYIALNGGVLCVGTALLVVTVGMTSGTLTHQNDLFGAALFTLAGALGYVPLVYTTAITSGVFTTGSRFVLAAGMFVASANMPVISTIFVAFVVGALVEAFEASVIGMVGNKMNSYPELRVMGNHIRKAMSELLDVSLLVGSVVCGGALTGAIGYGGLGSLIVIGLWMLNKQVKKKFIMQMVVAPVTVLILAVLVNIISYMGLAI